MLVAFIIWAAVGCFFLGLGVYSFFSKKAVGFWANSKKTILVNDVKGYNRAVGFLWLGYGTAFIALGLPLLFDGMILWIMLSSFLVALLTIVMMVIYTLVIERKYRE